MSDYLVLNVCAERLFGEAPSGVDIWHGSTIDDLIAQLPFKEEVLSTINAESDVVSFSETFTWMFGDDHLEKFLDFTKGTGLLDRSRATESKTTEARLVAALKYIFAIDNMFNRIDGRRYGICRRPSISCGGSVGFFMFRSTDQIKLL
ncbi:MAG: hypothetical protein MI725_09230 [Pirellulales bacterium]|nr:hypothetical protein [Pirellulales bacterium]